MDKIFSNTEIDNLYRTHIKKDKEYFAPTLKREILSLKFEYQVGTQNFSFVPEGHDYPRLECLLDFRSWVKKYNIKNIQNLLCTDISDPELYFLNFENHNHIPYDFETEGNDLHKINLKKNEYDFVLFSQTLEHLYNPFMVLQNLYHAMKDGGYIFTSLPTINIPHMTPVHFTGYTPMGLCLLFESVGFKTVEVGYWGNYNYIKKIFKNHWWPDYRKLLSIFGDISNEEKNVVQTWILAKK